MVEEATRPEALTPTKRFSVPKVNVKQRALATPPNALKTTVPGTTMATPSLAAGQTRNGGSAATDASLATHPLIHAPEQLAWSLLEHRVTGIPRLTASLRANCKAATRSLVTDRMRLFSISERKLGTPMASTVAKMETVTINSISVKPVCFFIGEGRSWKNK